MITSIASEGTPAAKLAAVTRRDFIKRAAVGGVAVSVMGSSSWAEEKAAKEMIYRTLGSTGQKVSAIGLGGFHIGNPVLESESLKIIRSAIDRGITFMDVQLLKSSLISGHSNWSKHLESRKGLRSPTSTNQRIHQ